MRALTKLQEDSEDMGKRVNELKTKHRETFDEGAKDESAKKRIVESLVLQQEVKDVELKDVKEIHRRAKATSRTLEKITKVVYEAMPEIQDAFGIDGSKPASRNPDLLECLGLTTWRTHHVYFCYCYYRILFFPLTGLIEQSTLAVLRVVSASHQAFEHAYDEDEDDRAMKRKTKVHMHNYHRAYSVQCPYLTCSN
jgi:hypothetical protein